MNRQTVRIHDAFSSVGAPLLLGLALGGSVLLLSGKALVLLCGGIGVVLMTIVPEAAYYVFVATIPVAVDLIGGLTVTKLVTPLVIGLTIANALMHRCPWPTPFRWPEGYLASAFFGICALSLLFARDIASAAEEAAVAAVYAAIFFLTITFLRTPKALHSLVWVLIFVGIVEAIIAIAQAKYGFVLPGEWRKNVGLPVEGGAEGTYASLLAGRVRVEGTTVHPIVLASFFLVVIPLAVTELFVNRDIGIRIGLLASIVLMVFAWFYTYARSSALAMGVMAALAIGVAFKINRHRMMLLAVIIVLAGLALAFRPQLIASILDTIESTSLFERADLNSAIDSAQFRVESILGGWNLFLSHPWFGVGYGQAIFHYMPYLPPWASHPFHPTIIHNVFLEIASEVGSMGLLAFVGLWICAIRGLMRGMADARLRTHSLAFLVILIGQFVFLFITPMVREIWLTLATGCAIGRMCENQS